MRERELRILLADDDMDDRLLFKEALESLPVTAQLMTVNNGEQLMLLLNGDTNPPDILFLDLNMPRKNGFDCLEEIRQNQKLNGVAIIPISTSFEQAMVDKLYAKGAQHYIRKPNEFSTLKTLIQDGISLVSKKNFV
ncbi:MAG: response regulator [Sediminibacterium sp.]